MKKQLLAINSSLQEGYSMEMVSHFSSQWQQKGGNVIERDLAKSIVPHLDSEIIDVIKKGLCESQYQEQALALSDTLISEIREADAIVIGMPMYNLAAPSVFQSYMDHVLRAGITFKYSEQGPVGLLSDKPVYILCARGGMFNHDNAYMDTQTPWLKNILGFIGLSSVQFIYAECLGMGGGVALENFNHAKNKISNMFQLKGLESFILDD